MKLRVSWALVLLLIAALEFVRSYSGFWPVVDFAFGVVAPFLLLRLATAFRAPLTHAAVGVMVLAVAGAWWALRQSGVTGVAVFTDAVPRLLTSARPAPTTPPSTSSARRSPSRCSRRASGSTSPAAARARAPRVS